MALRRGSRQPQDPQGEHARWFNDDPRRHRDPRVCGRRLEQLEFQPAVRRLDIARWTLVGTRSSRASASLVNEISSRSRLVSLSDHCFAPIGTLTAHAGGLGVLMDDNYSVWVCQYGHPCAAVRSTFELSNLLLIEILQTEDSATSGAMDAFCFKYHEHR